MPTRPDRNLAIERLLREAHAAPAGAKAGVCVAAEELAAWVDGGLSEVDASRVEAHLASCPACQALLGAFASTEPVAAASRSRGLTRALLPLAAAAVLVVGVWQAGTRRQDPASVSTPAARQMARVEQPSAAVSTPAPPPPRDSAPRPSADRQANATLYRSDASRPQAATARPVAVGELAQERRREADADAAKEKTVEAASPALAPPAPAAAPRVTAADAAAEAAATPQAQAVPPAPQRSRLEGVPASARLASAPTVDGRLALASPDGASRWRIRGTELETSSDGGAAWLPAAGVTPAELADVTSGASPARGVSWLVGRGGLVLVTTDGRRFTRTSPPAPAPLTGVEAMDGMTAEVRASDGRAWRTVNAGRTWTQVR